ncbi:hypothetical protein JSO59_002495 [Riemerella anatipestifer]|uniref:hypothetical protein n=1 Tax=Riemerella anatipestifer TaxID=34085 RepID=UPI0030ED7CB4
MSSVLRKVYYYLFVRESKWNMLFILIPFIIFCIFLYHKNSSIEEGRYSIGIITNKYWPIVSHESITYIYYKKGIEYNSSAIYNGKSEIGGRYLVQFSLKYNFGGAKIFQDIPIPDSIKSAPAEGWKELPEWAKEKMKRYNR